MARKNSKLASMSEQPENVQEQSRQDTQAQLAALQAQLAALQASNADLQSKLATAELGAMPIGNRTKPTVFGMSHTAFIRAMTHMGLSAGSICNVLVANNIVPNSSTVNTQRQLAKKGKTAPALSDEQRKQVIAWAKAPFGPTSSPSGQPGGCPAQGTTPTLPS